MSEQFFNDTFDNFSFSTSGRCVERAPEQQNVVNIGWALNDNEADSISCDDSVFLSDSFSFTSFTNTESELAVCTATAEVTGLQANKSQDDQLVNKQYAANTNEKYTPSRLNVTVNKSPARSITKNKNDTLKTLANSTNKLKSSNFLLGTTADKLNTSAQTVGIVTEVSNGTGNKIYDEKPNIRKTDSSKKRNYPFNNYKLEEQDDGVSTPKKSLFTKIESSNSFGKYNVHTTSKELFPGTLCEPSTNSSNCRSKSNFFTPLKPSKVTVVSNYTNINVHSPSNFTLASNYAKTYVPATCMNSNKHLDQTEFKKEHGNPSIGSHTPYLKTSLTSNYANTNVLATSSNVPTIYMNSKNDVDQMEHAKPSSDSHDKKVCDLNRKQVSVPNIELSESLLKEFTENQDLKTTSKYCRDIKTATSDIVANIDSRNQVITKVESSKVANSEKQNFHVDTTAETVNTDVVSKAEMYKTGITLKAGVEKQGSSFRNCGDIKYSNSTSKVTKGEIVNSKVITKTETLNDYKIGVIPKTGVNRDVEIYKMGVIPKAEVVAKVETQKIKKIADIKTSNTMLITKNGVDINVVVGKVDQNRHSVYKVETNSHMGTIHKVDKNSHKEYKVETNSHKVSEMETNTHKISKVGSSSHQGSKEETNTNKVSNMERNIHKVPEVRSNTHKNQTVSDVGANPHKVSNVETNIHKVSEMGANSHKVSKVVTTTHKVSNEETNTHKVDTSKAKVVMKVDTSKAVAVETNIHKLSEVGTNIQNVGANTHKISNMRTNTHKVSNEETNTHKVEISKAKVDTSKATNETPKSSLAIPPKSNNPVTPPSNSRLEPLNSESNPNKPQPSNQNTMRPNNTPKSKPANQTENYVFSQNPAHKLSTLGLPEMILQKYESRHVTYMFPWQVECLNKPNVLENHKNLVYSAPTSAGKTLVAEILAIKTVIEREKKVLFILPYVSVVREKMFYFQDILGSSGVRVEGFMGCYNPPGGFRSVQVAICTIEKANSLVNRLLEEDKLSEIGAVVVDEMHLLGDPGRGYLLELLLTKLRYMSIKRDSVNIQIIGMSATLPNLGLLADWLDAELYTTTFRPIPLLEQCQIAGEIFGRDMELIRKVGVLGELDTDTDNILQLCLETISSGCSVLIFCPTKNWCENLAQQIAMAFWKLGRSKGELGKGLREQLSAELVMECMEQLKSCPVGLDQVLGKTVCVGVAFHHAGLTMDERDIVEGGFRGGSIRVLIATSTLSSGVNLPARRVIIRSPNFNGKPIDTLTYRQMIGRAGRMGKDVAGESILICQKTDLKTAKVLMSANLQPIESCLEGAGKLKRAILEVVTSNVAATPEEIDLFTKCTLLASGLKEDEALGNPITDSLDFLITNEFVRLQLMPNGESKYVATSLAKACLSSSLPPEEGLALFAELEKARQCFVLETELHLLYLVTPYTACNQLGNLDWFLFLEMWDKLSASMKRVGELVGVSISYLISATRGQIQTNTNKLYHKLQVHKRFYTALILQDLVNEIPLSAVAAKYNCNRGMLQSLQQSAATFASMVTSFSKQLGWSSVEILVSQFQDRLQFGISRDLMDLMRLPILNGQRARTLYNAGIEGIVDLAGFDMCELENILHKSRPFESEKERDGESEHDTKKRNTLRTIWVTGKQGLTERQAAEMLIKDARQFLKYELGLCDAKWDDSGGNKIAKEEDVVNTENRDSKTTDVEDVTNIKHSSVIKEDLTIKDSAIIKHTSNNTNVEDISESVDIKDYSDIKFRSEASDANNLVSKSSDDKCYVEQNSGLPMNSAGLSNISRNKKVTTPESRKPNEYEANSMNKYNQFEVKSTIKSNSAKNSHQNTPVKVCHRMPGPQILLDNQTNKINPLQSSHQKNPAITSNHKTSGAQILLDIPTAIASNSKSPQNSHQNNPAIISNHKTSGPKILLDNKTATVSKINHPQNSHQNNPAIISNHKTSGPQILVDIPTAISSKIKPLQNSHQNNPAIISNHKTSGPQILLDNKTETVSKINHPQNSHQNNPAVTRNHKTPGPQILLDIPTAISSKIKPLQNSHQNNPAIISNHKTSGPQILLDNKTATVSKINHPQNSHQNNPAMTRNHKTLEPQILVDIPTETASKIKPPQNSHQNNPAIISNHKTSGPQILLDNKTATVSKINHLQNSHQNNPAMTRNHKTPGPQILVDIPTATASKIKPPQNSHQNNPDIISNHKTSGPQILLDNKTATPSQINSPLSTVANKSMTSRIIIKTNEIPTDTNTSASKSPGKQPRYSLRSRSSLNGSVDLNRAGSFDLSNTSTDSLFAEFKSPMELNYNLRRSSSLNATANSLDLSKSLNISTDHIKSSRRKRNSLNTARSSLDLSKSLNTSMEHVKFKHCSRNSLNLSKSFNTSTENIKSNRCNKSINMNSLDFFKLSMEHTESNRPLNENITNSDLSKSINVSTKHSILNICNRNGLNLNSSNDTSRCILKSNRYNLRSSKEKIDISNESIFDDSFNMDSKLMHNISDIERKNDDLLLPSHSSTEDSTSAACSSNEDSLLAAAFTGSFNDDNSQHHNTKYNKSIKNTNENMAHDNNFTGNNDLNQHVRNINTNEDSPHHNNSRFTDLNQQQNIACNKSVNNIDEDNSYAAAFTESFNDLNQPVLEDNQKQTRISDTKFTESYDLSQQVNARNMITNENSPNHNKSRFTDLNQQLNIACNKSINNIDEDNSHAENFNDLNKPVLEDNNRKRTRTSDSIINSEDDNCIMQSPVKKTKFSKERKQRANSVLVDSTFIISENRSTTNHSIAEAELQSADFSHVDIINVCDDKKLFECFRKEIMGKPGLSLAVACEEIAVVKAVIGSKNKSINLDDDQGCCFKNRVVRGVAVCWGGNGAYYMALESPIISTTMALQLLRSVLGNKDLELKMFDVKEHLKVLKQCCNVDVNCSCGDPKVADWLLDSEGSEKSLHALVLAHAPEVLNLCDITGSCRGSPGLDLKSSRDARIRASVESVISWHLNDALKLVLGRHDSNLIHTYGIEMKCITILSKMEQTGFGIELKELQKLADDFKAYTNAVESKAYQLAGRRFSFASTKEVAKILGMYKGVTNRRVSTSKQVLEQSTHPISSLILQWRKLNSTLTKMVYPMLRLVDDGRIYGTCITYNATGRVSMHEPNLQNVPRDFEFVNPVNSNRSNISCRKAFVAVDKNVLVSADYCQLELRLLAHLSQDSILCGIMKSNEDVFRSISAKWNNINEEQVTDTIRQQTKQICYGIIYGMGNKTLAEQLSVTEDEAVEFVETFHKKYPAIRRYISDTIANCKETGYVETIAGRRRYLEHINHTNPTIKSQAERQAVNTTIQGSAADIAKNAMVLVELRIEEKFKSSRNKPKLVLQLHDELVYEVPEKYLSYFGRILKKCMQGSVQLSVPFPVKLKSGKSWGGMKENSL